MTADRRAQLRLLEGCRVNVALADGSRIDDCELVSAGRPGPRTVWVFTNGRDAFLPLSEVTDVWEVIPRSRSRPLAAVA
jgi:hypothetical protein